MIATALLWGRAALGFLKGLPREVWYALAAALILFLAYNHGKAVERDKWVAEVTKIRAERDAAMAIAAEVDRDLADEGEAAIEAFQEAIENETANIPDQGLTARQRARVCIELRRQGRRCSLSTSPAE